MAQATQNLSLPLETPSPVSATKPVSDDVDDLNSDDENESLLIVATGTTAVGYYLSTLLHFLAYGVAAVVFTYVGQILQEDDVVTPIRASLDDFDREAEQPRFEIVQDISLGSDDGASEMEQISNNLMVVENGLVEALNNELDPSFFSRNEDAQEDEGAGTFLFKLPESGLAVTKGSFTVWTEPERPSARQPYLIVIEIMLKEGTRVYRVNDLSGLVVGSDDYKQKIPYDSDAPFASFYTDENLQLQQLSSTKQIKVRNNKVQLAIKVPGANRLVKDTIQIRSRRLRERQELELIFGR